MADINFNINDEATIYPTEAGWNEMFIALEYKFSQIPKAGLDAHRWIEARKTADGGYRDQLWQIMQDFGSLIRMGANPFDVKIVLHNSIG